MASIFERLNIFKKKRDSDKEEQDRLKAREEGEGLSMWDLSEYGLTTVHGYSKYISWSPRKELDRLKEYRIMASYSEVADVIETMSDEGTAKFEDGNALQLKFIGDKFSDSGSKTKTEKMKEVLQEEFEELFLNRLKMNRNLWEYFHQYLVDGKLFLENVINENNPTEGIKALKILPPETMHPIYKSKTGNLESYKQVLIDENGQPLIDINGNPKTIDFDLDQISYVYYNKDPKDKRQTIGYLDKAIRPYRQLRLLEDSVVIYRIVRAPERLVFTIDVGGMPKGKAMQFVKQLQQQFSKKMTYDIDEGKVKEIPNAMSMLENFWIPKTADGRGPSVEVLQGGENLGEIRDLEYFMKKLYKALKYPLSRTEPGNAGGQAFYQSATEITREEIKFAKFIERLQQKLCEMLVELFFIHLNFKDLKNKYSLTSKDIHITMKPPSNYKELSYQNEEQRRVEMYLLLSNEDNFSKKWLMKRYLKLTDEDINEMEEMKKDENEEDPEMGYGMDMGGGGFGSEPDGGMEQPQPDVAEPAKPEVVNKDKEE